MDASIQARISSNRNNIRMCKFFSTAQGCRFGQKCKFSHDADGFSPSPARNRNGGTSSRTNATSDALYNWQRLIPLKNLPNRFPTELELRHFFQQAWLIVQQEDHNQQQKVIETLAQEGGLRFIRSLIDLLEVDVSGVRNCDILRRIIFPFFQVISHADILSSLLLENHVGTIFNIIHGPNGNRAAILFSFTASAIASTFDNNIAEQEYMDDVLTATTTVLYKVIDINQTAQINDTFVSVFEIITAYTPEDRPLVSARQLLTKIKRRLNLGSEVPLYKAPSTAKHVPTANFTITEDPPGHLSRYGPRHDNDHQDIRKIKILPTAQEILSARQEYLPTADPAAGILHGLAGLLDRHFRLHREDQIGPLRDAVHNEVKMLRQIRAEANSRADPGLRTIAYQDVQVNRFMIDKRRGLQLVLDFAQPKQVQKMAEHHRKLWWEEGRFLQVDSLVCLITAEGHATFFTVSDPVPVMPRFRAKQDPSSDDEEREAIAVADYEGKVDLAPSLWKNKDAAGVQLTFLTTDVEGITWFSEKLGTVATDCSLVEFPGLLLPSFQPTLEALQEMMTTNELPFANILAPDDAGAGEVEVLVPEYARVPNFSFELNTLTNGKSLQFRPDKEFDHKLFADNTQLDEAQQTAVLHALGKSIALIQGPPGTGKSYTGVAMIKTLLGNRERGDLGPIICVTYTNHALDQLLEKLVEDGVKQIIRMGSRSKSEVLKDVILRVVANKVQRTTTESHELGKTHSEMDDIVRKIETKLTLLNQISSPSSTKQYLLAHALSYHEQIYQTSADEDGFTLVENSRNDPLIAWLYGRRANDTRDDHAKIMEWKDLHSLSKSERFRLYRQ
ncbi:hypothetical protein MMC25_001868 [Agyrium rufum]|nr:hypothetical protein [Agyrium rufum]